MPRVIEARIDLAALQERAELITREISDLLNKRLGATGSDEERGIEKFAQMLSIESFYEKVLDSFPNGIAAALHDTGACTCGERHESKVLQ